MLLSKRWSLQESQGDSVWASVVRLLPSWRLTALAPEMSATAPPIVAPTEVLRPVNALAVFEPRASPEVTSLLDEVFFASTDVRPPETTPTTWPPTAEPVFEVPDWLPVERLLPFWTFVPVELLTSARAKPAAPAIVDSVSAATSNDLNALCTVISLSRKPDSSRRLRDEFLHTMREGACLCL
jgi:hypothetical protein